MFKKYKLLLILFLIITSSPLRSAELSIAYLDMNIIINQSVLGNSLNKKIDIKNKKISEDFIKKEKKFNEEKKLLMVKKNILETNDYQKMILEFNTRATEYENYKRNTIKSLSNERLAHTQKFLIKITKVLAEYSDENSIDLIIQKKNIIIGKKELDITQDFLDIVNKKIKKINN